MCTTCDQGIMYRIFICSVCKCSVCIESFIYGVCLWLGKSWDLCGLGLWSALESRNSNTSLVWQALLQRPTPHPEVSEKASELSTQNRIPGPH